MQDVERKTGLLYRFEANRKDLERLRGGLERLGAMSEGEAKRLARTLEDEVAELIARG